MILVTGGAGFIGSNIAASLASDGEIVAIADRLRDGTKWRNLAQHPIADIVAPSEVIPFLDRQLSHIKAVVHMGAISATTETNVDLIIQNNFHFSREIWGWCAYNKVPLIYASSAATYGDGSQGFVDSQSSDYLSKLAPLNPYGWSKLLFDQFAVREAAKGCAPPQWAGLKFFNVYGPNEYHKGPMRSVLVKSFDLIRAGNPVHLFRSYRPEFPDGGQQRDFVYVSDCVSVIKWLLDNFDVSGLFNLGTGQARSFLDLVNALYVALGETPEITFIDMPDSIRGHYQYFTEGPIDKLRLAGYRCPATSLDAGVERYVKDFLTTSNPYR